MAKEAHHSKRTARFPLLPLHPQFEHGPGLLHDGPVPGGADGLFGCVALVALCGLGLAYFHPIYFAACFVTGMLLGMSAWDRSLLQDDKQLEFSIAECIDVKREAARFED